MVELSNAKVPYFFDLLPRACRWRLFKEFRDAVGYLDIETTGLAGPGDYITTIVVYDGRNIHYYIHGRNMDDFASDITKYALVVTYNGSSFDLPFIRSRLGVSMDHPHIDLRQLLASLGYTGGQKACEKGLSLQRNNCLAGANGLFAMGLWLDYLRGNEKAIDTLVAYNALDAVYLERLMVRAYNLKIQDTPFAKSNKLTEPKNIPRSPLNPHQPTIDRLKRRYSWG
jgi:uncharacterized protein YprB with RNaseH-like and TPR domain